MYINTLLIGKLCLSATFQPHANIPHSHIWNDGDCIIRQVSKPCRVIQVTFCPGYPLCKLFQFTNDPCLDWSHKLTVSKTHSRKWVCCVLYPVLHDTTYEYKLFSGRGSQKNRLWLRDMAILKPAGSRNVDSCITYNW